MIPASVMMKLATLGLSEAQAEAVATMLTDVEAATAADAQKGVEKGREKARIRWHTWNNKRLLTTANVSQQLAGVEGSSSKKDNNKEEKKESAAKPRGVDDFVAELSPILDAERIDALVAVRRKKGAVLSRHAGKLLSQALLACPNVNEAADEMVLRNWTGIKPDWLDKRTTGPPNGKRMNAVEANLARRIRKDESASGRRDYGDVQLLPPDRPGLPDFAGDVGKAITWRG